jgi:hypothetical protein
VKQRLSLEEEWQGEVGDLRIEENLFIYNLKEKGSGISHNKISSQHKLFLEISDHEFVVIGMSVFEYTQILTFSIASTECEELDLGVRI